MLILLAVLTLAAPDAAASGPAPGPAAGPPAAKPAPGKKQDDTICITKAKVGTRFKERICYDRAEYERRQEEERKALDRMQRVPYQGS